MSKCKAIAALFSCVLGLVALVFVGHEIARARDFGVQGKQWSIDERDMLEVIEERLTDKEEEWAQIQQQRRDNAIRYAERPPVVAHILPVSEEQSWVFDPSIIVEQDIFDHRGVVIAEAGTIVNPLDYKDFPTTMLFINGDDAREVEWAMGHAILPKPTTIVLVKGAPIALMREHKARFFFDQGGFLTRSFGISHHPARVRQAGEVLVVEELFPSYEHIIALKPQGDGIDGTY